MARLLKPQEVETVRHVRTGETAIVYFDRNEKQFFAVIGTDRVSDKTFEGCKRAAYAALESYSPYVWERRIYVEAERDKTSYGGGRCRQFRARAELVFWRCEVAKKKDGSWIQRPFLDEEGLTDSDLDFHSNIHGHDSKPKDMKKYKEDRAVRNKEQRALLSDIHGLSVYEADVFIPYSEEAWAALHAVRENILQAEARLETMMSKKNIEQRLLEVTQSLKLLPPPENKTP